MWRSCLVSDKCNIESPLGPNQRFHSKSHLPNLSYQKPVNASSKYTTVIYLWLSVHFTHALALPAGLCITLNRSFYPLFPPAPMPYQIISFRDPVFCHFEIIGVGNSGRVSPWVYISSVRISVSDVGIPVGRRKVCGRYESRRDWRIHSWLLGIFIYLFSEIKLLKRKLGEKSNCKDSLGRFQIQGEIQIRNLNVLTYFVCWWLQNSEFQSTASTVGASYKNCLG